MTSSEGYIKITVFVFIVLTQQYFVDGTNGKRRSRRQAPLPIPTNCGAYINGGHSEEGVVTTPNYPGQYSSGLDCVWTIEGEKGKLAKLRFDDFDVTSTDKCTGDYVMVTSNISALDQATKYCGGVAPPEFISNSNELFVIFHSAPAGDTCRGFSAQFSFDEVVTSCGEEISYLEFDFQNPEYPNPVSNTTSHCHITVSHDCEVPICQLRLEFGELELQPPELGNCESDQFMVRANEPVPILCGMNHGHHMYVDVQGRSSTSLHVLTSPIYPKPVGHLTDLSTGTVEILDWKFEINDTRRWKVRVHQIPCDCTYDSLESISPKAPTGCMQYFDGIKDVIKSFNFEGTKLDLEPCWNGTELDCGRRVWTGHLNGLDYHVCVKVAEGYCGIIYTPTTTESFLLTGETVYNSSTNGYKNLYGSGNCQADYIVVPKSRTPGDNDPWSHDRFCGQALGNYVQGPIVSYSTPFYMMVRTDSDEYSRSVDVENRGFELSYSQLPCSGPYMFNSDQKYAG